MKKIIPALTALLGSSVLSTTLAADVAPDLKVGETMYNELCINCHAEGIQNAPRLGVKNDWLHRLPVGLDTLYQAVIDGPNHMYSKAGSAVESEAQIRSMIAYMMDSVTDEDTKALINSATEEEKARYLRLNNGYKVYDMVCFECHNTGDAGAPRLGSPEEWAGRKDMGVEKLTESVINGKGHMYTRALTANYSAADFQSVVEYMLSTLEKQPGQQK
ncbi:MAG: c-type cytochrome [Thiolinea sp.]